MSRISRTALWLVVALWMFGASVLSRATIVDLPDRNGAGYFYDTDTGYTWLDIDALGTSKSFNEFADILLGSPFHIATYAELREMHIHALAGKPLPDNFSYWGEVMGLAYEEGLPFIWGLYDNGIQGQYASAWVGEIAPDWTYVDPEPTGFFPSWPPYDRDNIQSGIGVWAVSHDIPNPFPTPDQSMSMLLLCTGLVGLALLKRGVN